MTGLKLRSADQPGIAISLDRLTKRYGSFTAVDQLTLQVPRGGEAAHEKRESVSR
jgi:ABC-type uncharacterized transport system ATPase subunit